MHICLFEDKYFYNFEPLIFSRPVYELLCSTFTLSQKILNYLESSKYSLHCRAYLQKITEWRNPGISVNHFSEEDTLFVNGRIIADENTRSSLKVTDGKRKVFVSDNQLVAVFVPRSEIKNLIPLQNDLFELSFFNDYEVINVNISLVNYIWDLITINSEEIKKDFNYRISTHSKFNYLSEIPAYVNLINEDKIFIEENVNIKPGVVLDASEGPIYIEKNSVIQSNAVIEGPCFIGESSIIKSLTSIYPGTSVGKVCKVGGEIDQSIIMPYSNKQHNGYLGNSYLGSWVNIGAGTNNSTLKNNYSKIKVQLKDREIDTGLRFLGLMAGDHSKCAINTMFNTGTILGFASNIFGSGFPDKYIPSFVWGGADGFQVYDVKKGIETARTMTSRRNVDFLDEDEKLFEEIFNMTKPDRDKKGF